MKNKGFKTILMSLLLLISASSIYGQSSTAPKPYSPDEFSQTAKNIHRFEIITLGSIPFVMLDTLIIYSTYKWCASGFTAGFQNPFTLMGTFNKDQIRNFTLTVVGLSLGIAITDLVINLVKQEKAKKKLTEEDILVLPEELNPPLSKLLPEKLIEERSET